MLQQGQVFVLKRRGRDGEPQCAYRYPAGGRDSRRIQRGGYASEQDAIDALERELDRVRRERRIPRSLISVVYVDAVLTFRRPRGVHQRPRLESGCAERVEELDRVFAAVAGEAELAG